MVAACQVDEATYLPVSGKVISHSVAHLLGREQGGRERRAARFERGRYAREVGRERPLAGIHALTRHVVNHDEVVLVHEGLAAIYDLLPIAW